MSDLATIASTFMSAVTLGSLFCVMSLGLTLMWGTLNLFNFAHGAFIMVGAFIAWYFSVVLGLSLWMTFVPVVVITFLAGVLLERVVIRPTLSGGFMTVVIATIAVSFILENLVLIVFGTQFKRLPPLVEGGIVLGDFYVISLQNLSIMIISLSILTSLSIFLKKTKLGMAIRAVSQHREASCLVGINVQRIYTLTIGISVALAGFSGILLGYLYFVTPTMGADILNIAFVIIVLGGLGSIKGTVIASYVVGLVQAFSMLYLGIFLTPLVSFTLMLVIMVVRPKGISGGSQ